MEAGERRWLERGLREAVLAGDEQAWKALYEASFDRLYAYVHYRTRGDRQQAEEIVQDCWLIAVRRIRRFDPDRGAFIQWLIGIADNVLRNHGRKWWRRRWTEIAGIEAQGRIPSPSASIEQTESVAMTLLSLPPAYQAVLRAKYEERLPVVEIATRWHTTPKAVESMLSRARQAFRTAYRQATG
ncbi:MAG TPA: sigma-70 family RNA polymerase sigma factor [Candidatus Hydrogenedentes bacterium]|nr:sigma-70 family RNA polymerase sigma factor [Candidatus Hydrogenedentota bacterium]HRT21416.1 sigma-70 family RNA polymerase sigma factor [Candidatus Hydrogenedentota bacterium]HRT66304.1 sigma-70 family RNA polymerase sigma factor [Candidatus Hydrogenedentota bacterium]